MQAGSNANKADAAVLSRDRPRFRLTAGTPFRSRLIDVGGERLYLPDRPSFAAADIDFDVPAIQFPIQVVTSLGLSGTTFKWLAAVGIALSGMFGTGWLWKILEMFRARREQLSATGLSSWSAKQLRQAIIHSFDYPGLKTLLEEEMSPSWNLDELVSKVPYRYQVGELIAVAAREGWLGSFVQSALNVRANKPEFVAVVRPIADHIEAKARTEPAPAAPSKEAWRFESFSQAPAHAGATIARTMKRSWSSRGTALGSTKRQDSPASFLFCLDTRKSS